MLHYLVTVTHPKHGDTVHAVKAAEPMLAAEAGERAAWKARCAATGRDCALDLFFAYKVEPDLPRWVGFIDSFLCDPDMTADPEDRENLLTEQIDKLERRACIDGNTAALLCEHYGL